MIFTGRSLSPHFALQCEKFLSPAFMQYLSLKFLCTDYNQTSQLTSQTCTPDYSSSFRCQTCLSVLFLYCSQFQLFCHPDCSCPFTFVTFLRLEGSVFAFHVCHVILNYSLRCLAYALNGLKQKLLLSRCFCSQYGLEFKDRMNSIKGKDKNPWDSSIGQFLLC